VYLAVTGPSFGTRESRHIDSRHQLTETDVVTGARFDDSVALGAWGMEWHDAETTQSPAVAEVQSALHTQGALIDGDDLPDPVDLVSI
jgi:hypothetical protein